MGKTALITGITGQDGSYLAELLLEKGYRVVGMTRRTSTEVHERIEHIVGDVEILSGDLLDQSSITSILSQVEPDEIYNLAAQSFVPASWSQPVLTGEFTALGVTRVLEAVRQVNPAIRFYQASSSEMFGNAAESPQNEKRPSIHAVRTVSQRFTVTGSRSTIANLTVSTPAAASVSITKAPVEARSS